MNFIWPSALLLLVVVAGLAVLYVLAQRRRNRYALRYANLSLVREAIGKGPGWRRHVPPALFILALAFMAIAVARPQAVVAVPSQEGTVILAIDVSGSMLAEDMKPNRMEAAKAAARAFVEKQSESVKIGVVSFSGDASIVQSPTTDKTLVIAAINRLRPQRATAIGRAVRTALDEATLKKIAEVTDAQYFNANTEADLRTVYENLTTQLVVRNEKTELTAYATLAAAILAVFAGAFSLLWFNRLP